MCCLFIAQPIGSFIGGQILGNGDQNTHYQLYNYIPVFVISFCAQVGGIIWVILVINENNNSKNNSSQPSTSASSVQVNEIETISTASTTPCNNTSLAVNHVPEQTDGQVIDSNQAVFNHDQEYLVYQQSSYISLTRISHHSNKICRQFRRLFEVNNVRELFVTLTRKRHHSGRTQIWTLFTMTTFLMFAYMNTTFVLWPYVEKLYSWPPKFYSNVTSIVAVVTLLVMGFTLPIFVRVFKFGDMRLALMGVLSLLAQCTLRGSWQHETGLYLSFICGSLAPLSFIGVRSRLSKIIEDGERGSLFALLAIVEAVGIGV